MHHLQLIVALLYNRNKKKNNFVYLECILPIFFSKSLPKERYFRNAFGPRLQIGWTRYIIGYFLKWVITSVTFWEINANVFILKNAYLCCTDRYKLYNLLIISDLVCLIFYIYFMPIKLFLNIPRAYDCYR